MQPAPMASERAKYANQPGRRKFARPAELTRAARCTVEARRPKCPSCGKRCPPPGHEDRDEFFLSYGHRRADGEPCPGWLSEPLAPPPPLPQEVPPELIVNGQIALFYIPTPPPKPVRKRLHVKRAPVPRTITSVALPLFDWLDAENERADAQSCEQ